MPSPIPHVLYAAQNNEWVSPGRPNLAGGPSVPGAGLVRLRANGVRVTGAAVVAPPVGSAEWSDSNLPWAYTDESVFTEEWPVGTTIVDIQTGSTDFWTNLSNTVAAAGKRVVVRLDEGVYHLKSFRLIGSSGRLDYAFGFWFPNLQGLLGRGPDKTFVQMDANSMTTEQVDWLEQMTAAAFAPNQMGFCRLDGANPSSPVLLGGITFQAADQQMMTSKGSDVPIVVPQPAPHMGVGLYSGAYSIISYCRFRAAGRSSTSAPPFEHANLSTSRGYHHIHHCEFDGRRAPELDANRPRRTSNVMGNNEQEHLLEDCWLHHTNVSRYAVNDQNAATQGTYEVTRVKSDHITELQNRDPNLNGGASLGGWTNASSFGWESCNGTIRITDPLIQVDNSNTSAQFACHFQLTAVGSRNPQGGRMYIVGGTYLNTVFPQLNGYITFRIQKTTYWYTDGLTNTLDIRKTPGGTKLLPYEHTGAWPPSQSQINAAGISPNTHYIFKGA
jgi:hypothetical protein